MRLWILLPGLTLLLLAACAAGRVSSLHAISSPGASSAAATSAAFSVEGALLLPRLRERPILKPFGIFVSPGHSPVSPERFTGYHTGLDFETFPDDQRTDVPVSALCAGTVKLARYVSGYGGVLVQSCVLGGQPVTVLYGHLRLASIHLRVGEALQPGSFLAVLGTGYTQETAGERKHLHLAIHRGTAVVLRGYVSHKEQLSAWLDPAPYVR